MDPQQSADPAVQKWALAFAALRGLGSRAPEKILRPTLWIRPDTAPAQPQKGKAPEAEGRLGGSHLGGRPDVAAGFAWPRKPGSQAPLSLLAQFDLMEAQSHLDEAITKLGEGAFADLRLPKSGRLLFFYDLEDSPLGVEPGERISWRVMRDPMPPARLRRHPLPDDLVAHARLPGLAVALELGFDAPQADHRIWRDHAIKDAEGFRRQYCASAPASTIPAAPILGALGGWAQDGAAGFDQDAARMAEGFAIDERGGEADKAAQQWAEQTLLLRLFGLPVDKAGLKRDVYFFATHMDLAARRFDNVQMRSVASAIDAKLRRA